MLARKAHGSLIFIRVCLDRGAQQPLLECLDTEARLNLPLRNLKVDGKLRENHGFDRVRHALQAVRIASFEMPDLYLR